MLIEGSDGAFEKYKAAQAAFEAWQEQNPGQEIDHPDAGASFAHGSPGEAAENLERSAAEEFHVPNGVIDELKEDHVVFSRPKPKPS